MIFFTALQSLERVATSPFKVVTSDCKWFKHTCISDTPTDILSTTVGYSVYLEKESISNFNFSNRVWSSSIAKF